MGRPFAMRAAKSRNPRTAAEAGEGPTGGGRGASGSGVRPPIRRARSRRAGRGCGLRDGAAVALVEVDPALVLRERLAELVAAVVLAHEVQLPALRGMERGQERRAARGGDGPRRQAGEAVRVVRRVHVEVALADVPVV